MTAFVALGDSTTAGFGDPAPGGGWRGWAAILADALDPLPFTNLARSGALTADVAVEQLEPALALRPAVAGLLVGVNDTLRAAFDSAAVGAALDRVVGALSASGAVV
jgi:lysophospholipase L1-like esterase